MDPAAACKTEGCTTGQGQSPLTCLSAASHLQHSDHHVAAAVPQAVVPSLHTHPHAAAHSGPSMVDKQRVAVVGAVLVEATAQLDTTHICRLMWVHEMEPT
jgi:hypothetical protein